MKIRQEKENPKLSIIIVSYNVKKLLVDCIGSIYKSQKPDDNWEIIVVDNNSIDNSIEAIANFNLKVIKNKENFGFSKANNQAITIAKGKYILLLNPDTIVYPGTIQKVLEYLENNPKVGAATCMVELPNGNLDYSCHRGFPTPWNAFTYFSGLSSLLPKLKWFTGYTLTYKSLNSIHEIDALTGAFALVRKSAGDEVNWFDEDYFWNGEDLDFCYKLREKNWKIVYIPDVKITHFKGSSSGLWHTGEGKPSGDTKMKSALSSTQVMSLFYKKHLSQKYPFFINWLVYLGIFLLERFRLIKNIA